MMKLRTRTHRMTKAALTLSLLCATPAFAQLTHEQHKLLANDAEAIDYFGHSVSISNSTIVVGAIYDDDNGLSSGSAYIYDATTGLQITKLLPNDGAAGDQFGYAVAISGSVAIIGATGDGHDLDFMGSAYLFDTNTGQQIAKLLPNDDGQYGFGQSVAISGSIAIVGAPGGGDVNGPSSGSAYLFDTTTGEQLVKLLPVDGAQDDSFGSSVGISDGIAIVGSPRDDDNGTLSGAAYLFDTTTGLQIAKLLPDDGNNSEQFGSSVAISESTAVIGARGDFDSGIAAGSAYLFDTTSNQQIAKLLADDAVNYQAFGASVAISGNTAIIGTHWSNNTDSDYGSAYLFDARTGQQLTKLVPSDVTDGDRFGTTVAISGSTVVAGAYFHTDTVSRSGAAYVFLRPCFADLTNDGTLDSFDVSAFLNAYAANEPIADFNNDGSFNFYDVSAFILAYTAGCP